MGLLFKLALWSITFSRFFKNYCLFYLIFLWLSCCFINGVGTGDLIYCLGGSRGWLLGLSFSMIFLSGRMIFYSGIPETVGFFSCETGYFFSTDIFLFTLSAWETGFWLLLTYFFTSGTTGFWGGEFSTTFFYTGLTTFCALLTYTFGLFWGCLFYLLAFIF